MYSSDVPSDETLDEQVLRLYGPLELLRQRMALNVLLIKLGISLAKETI